MSQSCSVFHIVSFCDATRVQPLYSDTHFKLKHSLTIKMVNSGKQWLTRKCNYIACAGTSNMLELTRYNYKTSIPNDVSNNIWVSFSTLFNENMLRSSLRIMLRSRNLASAKADNGNWRCRWYVMNKRHFVLKCAVLHRSHYNKNARKMECISFNHHNLLVSVRKLSLSLQFYTVHKVWTKTWIMEGEN